MKYLLEFAQEKEQKVGIFDTEESVIEFLEQIPFVSKDSYEIDGEVYVDYSFTYSDIPDYYEIIYNGFAFILSKYMFDPNDEKIDIFWSGIPNFDDNNFSEKPVLVDGVTRVDAFLIPNEEVLQYIIERDNLFKEAESYFKTKDIRLGRFLQGSEDGEAVCTLDKNGVFDRILFLLDPETLHIRKQVNDFEEFLDSFE